MKTTLPQKSKDHEEIIFDIRDEILKKHKDKIAFIILFGSFARGDWVYDVYEKDNITYQYASDYDLFIITKTNKQGSAKSKFNIQYSIEKILAPFYKTYIIPQEKHTPSIIVESIESVNKKLEKGKYFYTDIKKEGIMLYSSGEFELAEEKEKTAAEKKEEAEEYFNKWFKGAEEFFEGYKFYLNRNNYKLAAFNLHQATENLYHTIIAVYTGYRHKLHDLEKLEKETAKYNKDAIGIFPKTTKEEERLFELLRYAYVDARYEKYEITKEELKYLEERVKKLQEVTKRVCQERINSF